MSFDEKDEAEFQKHMAARPGQKTFSEADLRALFQGGKTWGYERSSLGQSAMRNIKETKNKTVILSKQVDYGEDDESVE